MCDPKVPQDFVPYGRSQKPARSARTLPRDDRSDMLGCEVCNFNYLHAHESFAHFRNHNSPTLSEWILPVMDGE
eukprot:6046520-Amphidinium_carterae.3